MRLLWQDWNSYAIFYPFYVNVQTWWGKNKFLMRISLPQTKDVTVFVNIRFLGHCLFQAIFFANYHVCPWTGNSISIQMLSDLGYRILRKTCPVKNWDNIRWLLRKIKFSINPIAGRGIIFIYLIEQTIVNIFVINSFNYVNSV